MKEAALEIINVSKSFGKKKVVDNVNITVYPGEICGFLGPNGAGKTTTIKMVLGLLSIDSGKIKVCGYDVKKNFEKAMENIGAIVENPDMYGYMSAIDNLKLYARIRGINKDRINEVIKLVDLEKNAKEKVGKYSLGMKQRIGLALTLLHKPKVLILDEPTNGLDPAGIKKLRDILKEISHKENVAILVSSHILSEMELMCDKVTVIDSGKIVKTQKIGQEEENETEFVIKVKQEEVAIKTLYEKLNIQVEKKQDGLHFNIIKEDISKVVKELVFNNIDVEGVSEKEKKLEDLFFDATSGGEEDE